MSEDTKSKSISEKNEVALRRIQLFESYFKTVDLLTNVLAEIGLNLSKARFLSSRISIGSSLSAELNSPICILINKSDGARKFSVCQMEEELDVGALSNRFSSPKNEVNFTVGT